MQQDQPTHFIEAWAKKDEYKKYDKKTSCTNTYPLPIKSLKKVLNSTIKLCPRVHTVAVFKIYPKNNLC